MESLKHLVYLLLFLLSLSCTVEGSGKLHSDGTKELFSAYISNEAFKNLVKEEQRTERISTVSFDIKEGSSIGNLIFIVCSLRELSKERGFRYFTKLDDGKDMNGYKLLTVGFLREPTSTEFDRLKSNSDKMESKRIYDVDSMERYCDKFEIEVKRK